MIDGWSIVWVSVIIFNMNHQEYQKLIGVHIWPPVHILCPEQRKITEISILQLTDIS